MANFQLIIPDQSGAAVAVKDFAKAVDAQLKAVLDSEEGKKLESEVIEQAKAAVDALKALVKAGHAGDAHVYATVSTRIDPTAFPPGTGHIVAVHLESRPAPVPVAAEEPAAAETADASAADTASAKSSSKSKS